MDYELNPKMSKEALAYVYGVGNPWITTKDDFFTSPESYHTYLRTLSDSALREETIAAVTEANALRMEACRKQWETLGRVSVFLECYNKAVDNMTHI